VIISTPQPHFTPGNDPVPIVQVAGWAPGPVWTGAENLTPPGFDPWTIHSVASRYTDYATRPTRRRKEDNIKTDLQEVGCGGMDWFRIGTGGGHL
jgi:hypothetical protein